MTGTSLHSVYRRTARAAAQQRVVKATTGIDVERAQTDFAYFCEAVGDKPPASHHMEWHKYLHTGDDSECLTGIAGPNIDILAPRGSAKSTVLGLFTAWSIGVHALQKKPLKILYISYTVDVARPKSAAIKRIIDESKAYKEVFPTVKIAKGINSNEYWSIDWKFAGIKSTGEEEFTVCCAGLKGAVTSKRSHLCLLDDVVKSADDIKNREVRLAMEDNWNSVIVPTMFEGGRAICLGTRFRHDDVHSTTFIPPNNWVQVVQSAISIDEHGDENSYWPDMWSLEYLQERRRQAPISFSFQYQNQIVQTSELSLTPDLIVKGEIATQFDCIGVGVDISAGIRERNDYTVFVMGGRVGNKIHIIDFKRIRIMGNLEKL